MGAPRVRPADVEGWFTELGLTPTERAERDGIASWDLVLDGRRRFDLRMTVILDPALAVICWAQYAPPISDMFRKSYRRLLRWNDEFPFAKFSVGEDERPLLAVEVPIGEADVDSLGLGLARILGIADRLLDESKDWLWIGGRMPDPGDRTSANAGVPGTLSRPPAGAAGAVAGGNRRSRVWSWRRSSPRPGCSLRRRASARSARRRPDLTIVTDARYDVQPDQHRVHVTVDMVLTNHLHDTATKRFYFDQRLPVRPAGHVGIQAELDGLRDAEGQGLEDDVDRRPARARPRAAAVQRQVGVVPARLRPRRQGRRGRPRRPDRRLARRSRSGPTPPMRRRGARSGSSSRPATRSRSSRATSRRRPPRPTARSHSRPPRSPRPSTSLRISSPIERGRLPSSRSARRSGASPSSLRSRAGPMTRRGPIGSADSSCAVSRSCRSGSGSTGRAMTA